MPVEWMCCQGVDVQPSSRRDKQVEPELVGEAVNAAPQVCTRRLTPIPTSAA